MCEPYLLQAKLLLVMSPGVMNFFLYLHHSYLHRKWCLAFWLAISARKEVGIQGVCGMIVDLRLQTRMRQSKLRCLLCSISKRYHVCRARSKCIGVPHDHFSLTPRPRLYIDEYLSSRCAGRCAVLTTSFTVSTTATIHYSTYTPATLLFLH